MDTFMSRLHSLPTQGNNITTTGQQATTDFLASGLYSIQQFLIEGRSYISSGFINAGLSGAWEQEVRRLRWTLSGDPTQMTTQQF